MVNRELTEEHLVCPLVRGRCNGYLQPPIYRDPTLEDLRRSRREPGEAEEALARIRMGVHDCRCIKEHCAWWRDGRCEVVRGGPAYVLARPAMGSGEHYGVCITTDPPTYETG